MRKEILEILNDYSQKGIVDGHNCSLILSNGFDYLAKDLEDLFNKKMEEKK